MWSVQILKLSKVLAGPHVFPVSSLNAKLG